MEQEKYLVCYGTMPREGELQPGTRHFGRAQRIADRVEAAQFAVGNPPAALITSLPVSEEDRKYSQEGTLVVVSTHEDAGWTASGESYEVHRPTVWTCKKNALEALLAELHAAGSDITGSRVQLVGVELNLAKLLADHHIGLLEKK